jgi:hypothetical protein
VKREAGDEGQEEQDARQEIIYKEGNGGVFDGTLLTKFD